MSTTSPAIADAPLGRRVLAWAAERWLPAAPISVLVIVCAAVLFERALAGTGELTVSARDLQAFAGALAYSLLIRVLDEHKDYDLDLVNHPDRVLQSGQVELRHLQAIGVVAFAVMLVVSLLVDGGIGPVTKWWSIVMAWTVLMTKEFFARDLHRRWRLLLAVTHGVAIPLMILWTGAIAADGQPVPSRIVWLGLLVCVSTTVVDVGRKLEAPEDERPTLGSYTRNLGPIGAAVLLATAAMLSALVGGVLLAAAGAGSAVAYGALALATIPALEAASRFARRPTRQNVSRTEALARLAALLLLLIPIVALVAARGVTWS